MKFLVLIIIFSSTIFAGNAGNNANIESRYLIDMPTAGVIEKKALSIYSNAYSEGGLLLEFNFGLLTNLNLALSYSASNVIGDGSFSGPEYPSVNFKYRVSNEVENFPAIAIGISTQGRGVWDKTEKRFQTYSPGFYIASSKNFIWALGNLALHGGINYSFEPVNKNKSPNVYFGFEQSLGSSLSLVLETNATLDDQRSEINKKVGLLNSSFRWSISEKFTIELQVRDMLNTQDNVKDFTRVITFEYISTF
ncbi:YjbH domain-containing protein [Candidatus Kapabacteria bacterium]|nr:YjbH domain-containing protein [Candidatus Kapabacteria bacterium]